MPPRPKKTKEIEQEQGYSGIIILEENYAINESDWKVIENAANPNWKDLTFGLLGVAATLIVSALVVGKNPFKDSPYVYFMWIGSIFLAAGIVFGVFWLNKRSVLKNTFAGIKARGLAVLDYETQQFRILRKPQDRP